VDLWDDISPLNPTQKPVALLERIIAASSNEGDVVLDPFCGCGATVHAAQKLKRQWIGIDVTHLAIALIERRLKEAFPGIAYEVNGVPKAERSNPRDGERGRLRRLLRDGRAEVPQAANPHSRASH
jgi:hypothetical protein